MIKKAEESLSGYSERRGAGAVGSLPTGGSGADKRTVIFHFLELSIELNDMI